MEGKDERPKVISGTEDREHESPASCTAGLRASIPAGRRANIDHLRKCGEVALHYMVHCSLLYLGRSHLGTSPDLPFQKRG